MPRLQFLGNIGQPLHVEAYEIDGNDIDAVCAGKKTNLHAVSNNVCALINDVVTNVLCRVGSQG